MKKNIIFILFLFFISSCFAQEINFQQENYAPSETIIGNVNNVISELTENDFKVYEGRREVFFEKGILKVNQTYYFYIIPTKEGQFSIKIDNLLYNNSGLVSSINLEKKFNISQVNNSGILGVKPGVYEGENPEIIITNLKSENINVTLNNIVTELGKFESRKVTLDVSEGFSFYGIGNYSIPIVKFSFLNKNETNISSENETMENKSYSGCTGIIIPPFFSIAKNEVFNYSMEIQNNCSEDLTDFVLKSAYTGIIFKNNNFTIEKDKTATINFSLIEKNSGDYSVNISLLQQNNEINNIKIDIYCFENKTNLENFTKIYDSQIQQNCSSLNGKFCKETEACSTDNRIRDISVGKMCCLSECVDLNAKPINWINILVAIIGISVIGAVGYILMKRSRGLRAPRAEDKFKEAVKKYDKNIIGKEK